MGKNEFSTDKQYREQLFKELIDIVGELGWMVSIPNTDPEDEVPGLIIGTPEYVDSILEVMEDAEDGRPN